MLTPGAERPGLGAASPESDAASPAAETLFVVAPHPDDETLIAGATLADAAARGVPHEVVIVTNGDLGCGRNGWLRQDETIAALAALGVTEEHVHFLGYPDGFLDALASRPLAPLPRAARDGTCGTGATTYGARGAEHGDVHTALFGAPAEYVADALEADLAALFERAPPAIIHVTHGIDTHPDHAATHAFVRRALARAHLPRLPIVVRHVVHAGPCWPATDALGVCVGPSPALGASPLPALPPPLGLYAPDWVHPVDAALVERWHAAIGAYSSQLEGPLASSWLGSFARATEAGWTEELNVPPSMEPVVLDTAAWRAPLGVLATLAAGDTLTLAAGDDGYVLSRAASEVVVRRGTLVLVRVWLPEPSEHEPLSLRVLPAAEDHVEVEVWRAGRYLGGGVDAQGITQGTAVTLNTERQGLVSAIVVDELDPLR